MATPIIRSALFLGLISQSLSAATNCPLLGPDFPAPSSLATSPDFKKGLEAFKAKLGGIEGLNTSDTAYSIGITSTASNETLYQLHYTPANVKNASHGVHHVDANSVYRIGSISKVFTVWNFLIGAGGDAHFNDPVSKYVPELKNASKNALPNGAVYDDINNIDWDQVTLGNLASHLSGIERELTGGDLTTVGYSNPQLKSFGLPLLNSSQIPACGADNTQPACTRAQFFHYLLDAYPAYPATQSPAYTNIAFQILAYAYQSITGQSDFGKAMHDSIFSPLGMNGSSFSVPASPSHGVIPGGNESETEWNWNLGIDTPGGGLYSSTNDLLAATRAMLSSTLLPPAQTRRWLKPLTHTADLRASVGAPWEIRSMTLENGFPLELYNKGGDNGAYHAQLLMSPAHGLAAVVLGAGTSALQARDALADALANTIFAGAEDAARSQAAANYAGTYTDPASNSTVTISTSDQTGLGLDNVLCRGAPSIELIGAAQGVPGTLHPRLFPTALTTVSEGHGGRYVSRTGWRAVFLPGSPVADGDQYAAACAAWLGVTVPQYGNKALDDFVFNLGEDGRAESIELRGFRLTLQRTGQ